MRPILNTTYKGGIQVEIYMRSLHHELVLFQQSRNVFRYVPDNEIKEDILGWKPSTSTTQEDIYTRKLADIDASHQL